MSRALEDARRDPAIGDVMVTSEGHVAFCSAGDQSVRGKNHNQDEAGVMHLNVLDFQRQIRTCLKPVIAMVAGYAIGGGHVLQRMCDLTLAAEKARFGQTGHSGVGKSLPMRPRRSAASKPR